MAVEFYQINIDFRATGELDPPSLLYTTKNVADMLLFQDGLLVAAKDYKIT